LQKGQRWKVSLINKREGRGFWANMPPSLLPPDPEQGRGSCGAGDGQSGRRRGPERSDWPAPAPGLPLLCFPWREEEGSGLLPQNPWLSLYSRKEPPLVSL